MDKYLLCTITVRCCRAGGTRRVFWWPETTPVEESKPETQSQVVSTPIKKSREIVYEAIINNDNPWRTQKNRPEVQRWISDFGYCGSIVTFSVPDLNLLVYDRVRVFTC